MLAAQGAFAWDVRGERGLADAAFLVEQGDDHGATLRLGRPACFCRAERGGFWSFCWLVFRPAAVVHRNAVSLSIVREFKLVMLEGSQTRAVTGFPAFSYP